eukprot:TRINITY_DN10175_c3_g1_i1.p1 TRINITY_DN10175_c3_g1~~TRINITY_DN10175_c3_g1_i1.p1  ORF type:complete len:156 (+),score=19.19 TRINITY_DN10175_c3_g1_i1:390-857(+)
MNKKRSSSEGGSSTQSPLVAPLPEILTPPPPQLYGTSNTFSVPPWHLNPIFNPPAREMSVTPSIRNSVQHVKPQRRRSVSTLSEMRQIEEDYQRVRARSRELRSDMDEQMRYFRETLSYTHTPPAATTSWKQSPSKSPVGVSVVPSRSNLSVQRI